MTEITGLSINQAEYDLENGEKGEIAVFIYVGKSDPKKVLDWAVCEYAGTNVYNELVDANLDNPWMRVVISDINNMKQKTFNSEEDKMYSKHN